MRIGRFRLPWPGKDPYWDGYINKPPANPNNLVPPAVRATAEGQVFPIKSDVHTPEVMTQHIKELGRFFGAGLVGVARLSGDEYPFAVVCAIHTKEHPRSHPGVGGQAAALTGAYVAFNLGAAIREFGYRATRSGDVNADAVAAAAGLGKLDAEGHLVVPKYGRDVYLTEIIRTDLPLSPGSQEAYEWATPTS